nr:PepSY domain-containing protein [Pleionea sp. CnH1-48]
MLGTLNASAADAKSCKVISKSQAIAAAQRQVKGKALSATRINSRGPAVYKVKILVKGRVKTINVDGCTARVIRVN